MKDDKGLKKRLRERGYKLTKQRAAILDAFENADKPIFTAQELYERVIQENPGTNFSTVYRNLEMLVQEKIVLRIERGRDASCYELNDKGEHHHHMICKICGKVRSIDFCPLDDLPEEEEFVPTDHKLEIYGFCRECLNQNSDESNQKG